MSCRIDSTIQTAEGIPDSCMTQAGTGQGVAYATQRAWLSDPWQHLKDPGIQPRATFLGGGKQNTTTTTTTPPAGSEEEV